MILNSGFHKGSGSLKYVVRTLNTKKTTKFDRYSIKINFLQSLRGEGSKTPPSKSKFSKAQHFLGLINRLYHKSSLYYRISSLAIMLCDVANKNWVIKNGVRKNRRESDEKTFTKQNFAKNKKAWICAQFWKIKNKQGE